MSYKVEAHTLGQRYVSYHDTRAEADQKVQEYREWSKQGWQGYHPAVTTTITEQEV